MSEAAAEFAEYVEDDTAMSYLASEEFEARCNQLFGRLDAGDQMTVADAAELVGLPFGVFRFLFAGYLAAISIPDGRASNWEHQLKFELAKIRRSRGAANKSEGASSSVPRQGNPNPSLATPQLYPVVMTAQLSAGSPARQTLNLPAVMAR